MFNKLMQIKDYLMAKKGQGMVEYALIVGGIAVIVVIVVALFRTQITTFVTGIFDGVDFNEAPSA